MPDPIRKALQDSKWRVPDTSARQRREEPQWNEYSVLAYDGLMPTQIVRRLTEQDGIDRWEATALPFRVDARPDTDDRRNDRVPFLPDDPTRYVDERRYVVDPMVGKHRFLGLWTGGPVRMTTDKRSGGREVTQVLTRTFPCGHGYVTDEHGNYVFSDAEGSRERQSVEEALSSHRSVVKRIFSSRLAFRSDVPGMYRTEIVWRDFTHESIPFVESEAGKDAVRRAAKARYGDAIGEVSEVNTQIDPNTNTVVIVAAALFKTLQEPESVLDLLAMPRVEGPCSRETLRAFGWNDLEDAEGYEFIHQWKWFDIKDTPEIRHFLEFDVHDKDILVGEHEHPVDGSDSDSDPDHTDTVYGLLRKEELRDSPFLVDNAADALNGRFAYKVGGRDHAWWRILMLRAQPDEQDGTLVYTVVAAKPKWFGSAGKRVDAAFEAQRGIGSSKRTVFPSLPRELAPEVAQTVTADENHVIASVQRQEGDKGREDIVIQQIRAWTWQNGDVPDNAVSVDGSPQAASSRRTSTVRREAWDLTFRRVLKGSALSLLQEVGARLTQDGQQGRITVKEVSADGEGTVSIQIHAEGVQLKVVTEWLRTGNYFSQHFRRIRYNVPEDQLEEGGLDEATHEIYSVDRQLNDDGTYDETRERVKPILSRIWFWLSKGRRHGRALAHTTYRNVEDKPQELVDGSRAGSMSVNEHGLIDAQTQDVDDDDDRARAASEDHFHRETSVRENDGASRIDDAGVANGVITSVQETEHPDGTFTHTVSEDSAGPECRVHYMTKGGDRHHPRLVRHTAFVNARSEPSELSGLVLAGTDRVEGSFRHNRFGFSDGQFAKWNAADDDDEREGHSETAFDRTDSDESTRAESRSGDAGGGNGGALVSVNETKYPDGTFRSGKTTKTPKPQVWSYSYPVRSGDKVGTVRVTQFRNVPQQTAPAIADDETCDLSQTKNDYGLFDGHWVVRPNWGKKPDVSAGGIQRTSWTVNRVRERRIRDDTGKMIDQVRTDTITHTVTIGTFTIEEAAGFIDGGSEGSRYTPTRVMVTAGIYRPGFICDKVEVTLGDWGPKPQQNQNQNT